MGVGATKEVVQKILSDVDSNKSGEIEWPEFLNIQRNFYPQKLKEFEQKFYVPAKNFPQFSKDEVNVFVQAFRAYDLDDSGAIDARELAVAFWSMGQGVTAEQAQDIVHKFDADGSGVIEWPEFLAIMADIYEGRDLTAPKTESAPPKPAAVPEKQTPVKEEPKPVSKPVASQPVASQPAISPSVTPKQTTSGSTASPKGGNPKCELCGKTVYPIEALSSGERTWHKGCFKCEAEGCGITLTLKTFTPVGNKIYCSKHVPKEKPTSVAVGGTIVSKSQMAVPKLNTAQGIKKDGARNT